MPTSKVYGLTIDPKVKLNSEEDAFIEHTLRLAAAQIKLQLKEKVMPQPPVKPGDPIT